MLEGMCGVYVVRLMLGLALDMHENLGLTSKSEETKVNNMNGESFAF